MAGVLFEEGGPNEALSELWTQMPKKSGKSHVLEWTTDLANRRMQSREYPCDRGSLATPPCTEGVRWFVMKSQPTAMSVFPRAAATQDATRSGSDVPMATTVRPMNVSLRPKRSPATRAPSTTHFPPSARPAAPTTTLIHPLAIELELSSRCASGSPVCDTRYT